MKQFNELVFSDNLYAVSHLGLVSEDTAYVVYKNLHSRPNPKGNIFIAAFTTAHARLHLYKAIEKLNERVLYMDTDSVVFTQQPDQWKPQLGNFLGEWTNEVASGSKIIDFTTCGPKNYGYVTKDARGVLKTSKKVKGLRLTDLVEPLVTVQEMNAQVERFAKRKARPLVGGPAKRACLVEQQKKTTRHYNEALSGTFVESGIATCLTLKQDVIAHGPCNCVVCANKTSVTVPQVQFRKNRRDGFIETADIYKEYQLVVNKRWLSCSDESPFGLMTLPYGYTSNH